MLNKIASFLFLTTINSVAASDVWITYPDGTNTLEFMYVTKCRNYKDSQDYCKVIGGELASAPTSDIRNFIVNTVYDGAAPTGSCSSWKGTFMGGTNNNLDTVTWFDGTTSSYDDIDWDQREPSGGQSGIGFKLTSRKYHTVYTAGDINPQICQKKHEKGCIVCECNDRNSVSNAFVTNEKQVNGSLSTVTNDKIDGDTSKQKSEVLVLYAIILGLVIVIIMLIFLFVMYIRTMGKMMSNTTAKDKAMMIIESKPMLNAIQAVHDTDVTN
eukprot:146369_1